MTNLKPDMINMTSQVDTYLNYGNFFGDIVISGTVVNGATSVFSVTIDYSRGKTRADLYTKNMTTLTKIPFKNPRGTAYTHNSSETATMFMNYANNQITATLSIFNGTGSSITLTPQTLRV